MERTPTVPGTVLHGGIKCMNYHAGQQIISQQLHNGIPDYDCVLEKWLGGGRCAKE